jgi:hypothetical protein
MGGNLLTKSAHSVNNVPSEDDPRRGRMERASDVYSRILLTKGIGYPLWIPEPPPEYETEGVSIGDVGLITFDGRFDILFNIFSSAAHDSDDFAPPTLQRLPAIQPRDVVSTPNIHSPGSVIASSSISRQASSVDANSQPRESR